MTILAKINEERKEAYVEGKIEGTLKTLFNLVRRKIISVPDAAKEADLSEADFINKMNEAAAST